MQKFLKMMAFLAVLFVLPSTPAMAQATRTWVSGVGDDVNPCSRTAPCKTFAGAISKTAAGGEINCLDSGGFGAVTITKALTIRCVGTEGGIAASNTNGIIINAATTDRIVIDGIDIQGFGTGLNGIRVLQAREVYVRNSLIAGFVTSGISVEGANAVNVTVENTTIFNANRGIDVTASGGNGTARVWRSYLVGNATAGIRVSGVGNKAEISGNVINRSTESLDIVSGGVVLSDGTNVASAGDAPTGPLPKI